MTTSSASGRAPPLRASCEPGMSSPWAEHRGGVAVEKADLKAEQKKGGG